MKTARLPSPDLPVGMYLVIETKTPQAVTMPVEPFLVSIPMTRIGDKTTGADNQNQKNGCMM